jgi:hypothetical protein
LSGVAPAQKKGPPAAGRPTLGPVVPPGAQRGTALDLALSGANLADPLAVGLSFPARVNFPTDIPLGKDSTNFRARVEVPPDAPLGLHRLRLATGQGLSNFRAFAVDALPQVQGTDANHSPATAQPVPVPCVVVGRVDAETSNFFKVTVAAGQRLSFEVLGRRLGSALDPLLRLHDARTGRELPRAYSDDAPGLQTDARLTHTFPEAGDYLIEVRDTTYKGGADYWFRLRIGDFPCALTPWPLAAKRGAKVAVGFAGPLVDGVAPVEVQVPADPSVEAVSVAPVGANGLPGWPVELLVSDHDEFLAGPSLQTPAEAQRLPVPSGVSGRFLRKSQRDHFVFTARKGQRYTIAAQTAELHSPADVYLTLRSAGGSELAHSDPQKETRIDFTAPTDGDYFIVAEHLNYAFGPNEVYHLTLTQPVPGFELSLTTDRVAVPQGQPALIPVQTLVRHDYAGPIELNVTGPAGLSGTVTVPANVQAPPPAAGQPTPPPFIHLPVRAAADLAPGVYEIKVRAKAVVEGREVVAYADVRAAVQQQMAGLPFPPRAWLRSVGVAVTPKPPFTLAARYDPPEAVRTLSTKLIVTAARDPGFDGAIELAAMGLPPNVTAAVAPIPPGQTEAVIELKVGEKANLGSFAYSVVGRARQGEREYTSTLLPPPLAVVLPFELKVEPNPVALDQGGRAKLTVTAARKGGYGGPIKLELRNLPANVSAGPATIGPGQTAAAVELTAAAGAPLGSRGDVDVLGTAPPGSQQRASLPFTVRVQAPPPPPALGLKAEPAALTLKAGAKAKLKITVERKHLTGPVSLTVAGLPAKVTAAPATVASEQTVAEIEMTAAPDAGEATAEATVTGKAGAVTGAVKVSVRVEK